MRKNFSNKSTGFTLLLARSTLMHATNIRSRLIFEAVSIKEYTSDPMSTISVFIEQSSSTFQ